MQKIWKSLIFGVVFAVVVYASNYTISGNTLLRSIHVIIWLVLSVAIHLLVSFVVDLFFAVRQKGAMKENSLFFIQYWQEPLYNSVPVISYD